MEKKIKPHFSLDSNGKNVLVCKCFKNFQERGEVAHFIAELENAKGELLQIFNEFKEKDVIFAYDDEE